MYTNQYAPVRKLEDPPSLDPLYYPGSDGQPMAGSGVHAPALRDAIMTLDLHYKHRDDVYAWGNMMMYYVEGDPYKHVSPDVFVALDTPRERMRDVWKTWEEGKLADFILEITSKRRKTRDDVYKPVLYRRLGVTEYWQYDLKGDYLDPPLKGRRLNAEGRYEPIPLSTSPGGVRYGTSKVLGLHLCLAEGRLRFLDAATGEFLLASQDQDRVLAILDERRRLLEEQLRITHDNDITSHAAIEEARAWPSPSRQAVRTALHYAR